MMPLFWPGPKLRLRRDGEKHTNPEGIDEDFYRQFYYEILDM